MYVEGIPVHMQHHNASVASFSVREGAGDAREEAGTGGVICTTERQLPAAGKRRR
jgi:hypothetical protein